MVSVPTVLAFLVWVAKRVLWDPLDELRKTHAEFVTRKEVEMHVEQLNATMNAIRGERDEGEQRIIRDIDNMRKEQSARHTENRTDIQGLTRRIDSWMQQSRGGH